MSFMEAWWNTLSALQQGLALLAIPATVILLLQTILLLFGIGGHDADHGETDVADDLDADDDADGAADTDADADTEADIPAHHGAHHAAGIRLFTLRGIVALFAVGGWLGIAMCDLGLSPALSIVIALLGGVLALFSVALIIRLALSLQENGTIRAKNAIAHTATVYIPIPPCRTGSGKVIMTLQERFVELDALTDATETIPTDTQVQVLSVTDKNELIVRPLVTK